MCLCLLKIKKKSILLFDIKIYEYIQLLYVYSALCTEGYVSCVYKYRMKKKRNVIIEERTIEKRKEGYQEEYLIFFYVHIQAESDRNT
jgi:hypothetical protein